MPKFRTAYEPGDSSAIDALDCSNDPGATKQEFREECDINTIMAQYTVTGVVPANVAAAQYGDFAEAPDYFRAQNILREAEAQFMSLPSAIRDEYKNNAGLFLEALHDEKNMSKFQEYGLLRAVEAKPAPVVTPPVEKPPT